MSEFVPSFRAEILRGNAYLVDKSVDKPGRGIVLSSSGGEGKDMTHEAVRDMASMRAREYNEHVKEVRESDPTKPYATLVFVDYDHMSRVLKAREAMTPDPSSEAQDIAVFLADQASPNKTNI